MLVFGSMEQLSGTKQKAKIENENQTATRPTVTKNEE